jgi:hypothetical protein
VIWSLEYVQSIHTTLTQASREGPELVGREHERKANVVADDARGSSQDSHSARTSTRVRPQVFVSFAYPELDAARNLTETLSNAGILCFFAPRDIQSGMNFAGSSHLSGVAPRLEARGLDMLLVPNAVS